MKPKVYGPYKRMDGYIYLCIQYSNALHDYSYITEHRYVMEGHLGRKLKSSEQVHHIDGNKSNNKISNLKVLCARDHGLMPHVKEVYECHNCGSEFNSRSVTHVYCSSVCQKIRRKIEVYSEGWHKTNKGRAK